MSCFISRHQWGIYRKIVPLKQIIRGHFCEKVWIPFLIRGEKFPHPRTQFTLRRSCAGLESIQSEPVVEFPQVAYKFFASSFIITSGSDDFPLDEQSRVCSLLVFLSKYLPQIK